MITADNDLIEQIVANVLAELQPPSSTPPVRAPQAPPLFVPHIELDQPVITADHLAAKVRPGQTVIISRKSVLTPSARDWMATRKISWTRGVQSAGSAAATSARWQVSISTVTPAVSTLRSSLSGWKLELLGTAAEVAEQAIRILCTGEADGVLAISSTAETVACLANRNPKVRAAVLSSAADLPELASQLSPNLLAVNPRGKSFVELRNLVRAVGMQAKPQAPQGM